jgi:hypothetical protein
MDHRRAGPSICNIHLNHTSKDTEQMTNSQRKYDTPALGKRTWRVGIALNFFTKYSFLSLKKADNF